MLGNQTDNWLRIPACNKDRRLTRDLVPDYIAMHRDPFLGRGDGAELTPGSKVDFRRQPAGSDFLELRPIKADQLAQRSESRLFGQLTGILQGLKLVRIEAGCFG